LARTKPPSGVYSLGDLAGVDPDLGQWSGVMIGI
jgi:hypothetical protein